MSRSGVVPRKRSAADLALFYREFYGRMRDDIARDIRWQVDNPNDRAGNMLCALGLVVYTEVLGRLAIEECGRRRAGNKESFYEFLDRMGGSARPYRSWRLEWEAKHKTKLYDALRNGLVHEYLAKVSTRYWFEPEQSFGLGEDGMFDLVLRIAPYHRALCEAAEDLFRKLGVVSSGDGELSETEVV